MPRKSVIKVASVPAVQNDAEASAAMAQMGNIQRTLADLDLQFDRMVADAQASREARAAPLRDQLLALAHSVAAYAEANRRALTANGRKSVVLPDGSVFGWRFTPPKVTVAKAGEVIAWLKARRLKRFIRIKEEVNKEAILAEPDFWGTIPGVSVSRREEFYIRPLALESDILVRSRKASA